MEGLSAPQEEPAQISLFDDGGGANSTERDKISLAQLAYANELAISGRDKAEIDAFLDKISGAMRRR